jgi:hypothetical protein
MRKLRLQESCIDVVTEVRWGHLQVFEASLPYYERGTLVYSVSGNLDKFFPPGLTCTEIRALKEHRHHRKMPRSRGYSHLSLTRDKPPMCILHLSLILPGTVLSL